MAAMISSISSFSASSLLRQRMGWQTARTRAAHHRQPLQPITHQLLVSLLEKQSVQSSLGKRYPFTAIHQRTILSTSLRLSSSDTHTDASSTTTTTYGSSAVRSMRPTTNTTDLSNTKLQLLSFYRFIPISQPESVRDVLFERLKEIDGLTGTVYIAEEGINAQFSVPVGEPLDELLLAFGNEGEEGCSLPFNAFQESPPNMGNIVDGTTPTFDRLIIRTRDCILRDGIVQGDGNTFDWTDAGVELEPSEWDAQLRQGIVDKTNAEGKSIQLLDCRNTYESDQGSFVSSIPLNTQTFSETWSALDSQVESQSLDPSEPVYIFCTGGIRCVKVGAYLKTYEVCCTALLDINDGTKRMATHIRTMKRKAQIHCGLEKTFCLTSEDLPRVRTNPTRYNTTARLH
eukprot:scaffold24_cov186-Alexandrium_tamarense.AAC.58